MKFVMKKHSIVPQSPCWAMLLVLFIEGSSISIAQITVTPNQTAAVLAGKLAGKGVTIRYPTLNCKGVANGLFNVVSSNLGLDSGIVLTTGHAATQNGSYGVNGNSINLASNDNGMPGDVMLNALAGQSTVDACSLEFDVVPNGDTIDFSYVFSSEEYKNAVCGPYNDAFAFFISGPGISGNENMALVPGTNIPVTINTINDGLPGPIGNISNCTSMGAGAPFTSYYIDNSTGQTLTHQGLTSVLKAVHAVTPCTTYHLKITIADAGDPLYDSGVFLEAGSLQTTSFTVDALLQQSPILTSPFCIKGCQPGTFRIKRSHLGPHPQTIRYSTGGDAISGYDYLPLADSVVIPANDSTADITITGLATPLNGDKTIKIYVMSPYLCMGVNNITDSASITIYDTVHIAIATPDTTICGMANVQLHVNGGYDMLTYNWSPATGLSNPGIKEPVAFPSENTTYQLTASIPGTNCPVSSANVSFNIKLTPFIQIYPDTVVCYNTSIRLIATAAAPNAYYSFNWFGPNGFSSTAGAPVINNAQPGNTGIYTIIVLNDTNGCSGSASVNVVVNTPDTPVVVSPKIICLNSVATALSAKGDNLLWYDTPTGNGDTSAPVPPTNWPEVRSYFVSQTINNCESPKAEIDVEIKRCCDGNITIPTAFTPNNDGLNDIFRPIADYGYFLFNMAVYNRWGQMVYNGLHDGWDGNFGGRPAEVGTYFYTMTFGCIIGGTTTRKGDVTLIR